VPPRRRRTQAARWLRSLDRRGARARFERRFAVERMAREYLSICASLPGVKVKSSRAFGRVPVDAGFPGRRAVG